MRARTTPEDRRLPDAQRTRLKALLGAIPEGAPADNPAVQNLLQYGLTLRAPWWGPTHNALDYMVRLGAIDEAVRSLRLLARCEDWGEPPPGPDVPATGWVLEA
jgi:hypothetical protein